MPAEIALAHYDAACRALALAKTTDEVREIRSAAEALRAYARQAKNRQLEIDAAEIRIRAERRVGELIAAQRETTGLSHGVEGDKRRNVERGSKLDPRPTLAEAGIDKHLADRARKLAAVPDDRFEGLLDNWRERAAGASTGVSTRLDVHFTNLCVEHYTPASIIAATLDCLGVIDLDPCSEGGARPTVPAARHFTQREDGLSQRWAGRVYMNPPYGREIEGWISKLCEEHVTGRVVEAITLVPARTDTEWFERLRGYICCFIRGRLAFTGNDSPAPFPSAVFYLGSEIGKFARCFGALGDLWQRFDREQPSVVSRGTATTKDDTRSPRELRAHAQEEPSGVAPPPPTDDAPVTMSAAASPPNVERHDSKPDRPVDLRDRTFSFVADVDCFVNEMLDTGHPRGVAETLKDMQCLVDHAFDRLLMRCENVSTDSTPLKQVMA